ncbi:addiction module protein [candidate division KSB1 bacterium]|nr:addiction module protein [candidate division KSB1 bacterium]NIR69931.1 addiction module protein [candidate division KSB1 bacterium]NIS25840.1 addiction module protein [candidate division KSB1 bacterium]NIT72715.1 addiction module protein [candidate division KSB1 bacterium]NIU26529.1 addiction module protein [candidate division KSB1 bacterium]
MRVKDVPEIAQMSTSEKILFLEELWDTIASEEANIPVPQAHKDELETRLQSYDTSPGDLLSLEELQERINRRK